MRLRVYVAGPYTAPTPELVESNVQRAIDFGIMVIRKGHIPYIPHLSHWVELRAQQAWESISYEKWLEIDREWIRLCDALLIIETSPGVQSERAYAEQLGMPIFYSVDDLP